MACAANTMSQSRRFRELDSARNSALDSADDSVRIYARRFDVRRDATGAAKNHRKEICERDVSQLKREFTLPRDASVS